MVGGSEASDRLACERARGQGDDEKYKCEPQFNHLADELRLAYPFWITAVPGVLTGNAESGRFVKALVAP